MCSKQCKCLTVPWQYIVAVTAPYDANLARWVRLHGFWAGWIFCSCFKLWSIPESSVNCSVWARGSCGQGGNSQPAGNFLDSCSLNWQRHLGSLLDHSHSCEMSYTLKQIQFTAQRTQKPWHKTGEGSSYSVDWLLWKRITKGSLPLLV